jgi:hypothetical protein
MLNCMEIDSGELEKVQFVVLEKYCVVSAGAE